MLIKCCGNADLWMGKILPSILGKACYIGKKIIYFAILKIYKLWCCIVNTQNSTDCFEYCLRLLRGRSQYGAFYTESWGFYLQLGNY